MKKAFITGSSKGIGKAIAISLAKDGFEVYVHCASSIEKAKSVVEEIENNGGKAQYLKANFCDIGEVKLLYDIVKEVDVLVLNASIQYRNKWENISLKDCYDQLNCNFISSLMLIQKAVPYMRKNGWGRIITVGSVQETKPHPDMLVYSASKAAQTNMVKSLSLQLAKDGITVNNIAPGVIYTDRNFKALSDPVYAQIVKDSIPVGYYGEAEDCSGMVSLLCSDEGRYITGQSIYIDGGKSVQ